jgi:hypothetical protein
MAQETRRVRDELEQALERAMAALAVNITAELIERTPVDTGWARSNWVPAIGNVSVSDGPQLSEEARIAAVPGQRSSQQSAIANVASYRIQDGPVTISNNVPYIIFLNEGSSAQAPSGFVQAGIAAGIQFTNSVVLS